MVIGVCGLPRLNVQALVSSTTTSSVHSMSLINKGCSCLSETTWWLGLEEPEP